MNFYEILKTKKLGRGSPDYWTQLFAEHVGGTGGWKIAELTGTLPMTFRSNGTALIDYRIYGTADGAGERTGNLLPPYEMDEGASQHGYLLYDDGTINPSVETNYVTGYIEVSPSTVYTLKNFRGNYASICFYDASKNYLSGERYSNREEFQVTIPNNCRYARLTAQDNQTNIFVEGSTPPETYIPYGYQIPLTVTNSIETKTTDVYIGDSKLLSGDYVDYESGKIYKAKRIHEDTVTIDGIEWDILDYDRDEVYKADGTRAKHTVTIQAHDVLNNLQYCERQALFYAESAMPAGTYHFTLREQPWYAADVNKTFKFTLTQALAAGSQICITNAYNAAMTSGKIKTFSDGSSTTVIETVDITEGSDGTDLGDVRNALVGQNTNSIQRALVGSNNWTNSAMRQWLNSSAVAGSVWTPKTKFDRPPSWVSSIAGFLNGMDEDFVKAVGTVKKTTALNTVTDGGGKVESDERFFLLSRSEVYGENEVAGGEGAAYSYYADYSDLSGAGSGADTNRIKYRNNGVQYWWLRSPNVSYANSVRNVYSTGNIYGFNANNSYGVAPACCIVLDDMDDWVKQTFYAENAADLPAIETFSGENTLDGTETVGEVTIKGQIKPQS